MATLRDHGGPASQPHDDTRQPLPSCPPSFAAGGPCQLELDCNRPMGSTEMLVTKVTKLRAARRPDADRDAIAEALEARQRAAVITEV